MILHGNMEVLQLKIFENKKKLEHKKNELKLDIEFLNNCKQLGVYPKFLIFKLPNVTNVTSFKRPIYQTFNYTNLI